ncbi:MAG: RluA family pseudouridine synthase [Candidatus Alcyoniella australis]|nr:RluA family pseudouridine synthase [Candidatus Alcyoniella australis]
MIKLTVDGSCEGVRLDAYLAAAINDLSRNHARELIEGGEVLLNGRPCKVKGALLDPGDVVELDPPVLDMAVDPEPDMPLRVAFEDEFFVAVDKPPFQHVHPLKPGERGTLAGTILARYPEMSGVGFGPEQPGLVNRIDFHTSGLVLAARDQQTFEAFRTLFSYKRIAKSYLALVRGEPENTRLTWPISSAVGRGNQRVRVLRDPQEAPRVALEARTDVYVIESFVSAALVLAVMRTGVRHQVRAHLANAGWPIVGDPLYGESRGAPRTMLHAAGLEFDHPRSGVPLEIRCPTPEDFEALKHAMVGAAQP